LLHSCQHKHVMTLSTIVRSSLSVAPTLRTVTGSYGTGNGFRLVVHSRAHRRNGTANETLSKTSIGSLHDRLRQPLGGTRRIKSGLQSDAGEPGGQRHGQYTAAYAPADSPGTAVATRPNSIVGLSFPERTVLTRTQAKVTRMGAPRSK